MSKIQNCGRRVPRDERSLFLVMALIGGAGVISEGDSQGQTEGMITGESGAQSLKRANATELEESRIKWGPVRFQTEAGVNLAYTDNVFYSDINRKEDFLVIPELNLKAVWPMTDLNILKLSLGLSYEWYQKNTQLNSDGPLVNPNSELVFNLFVDDFRFKFREKFSYEESLFQNSPGGGSDRFFNFNDVGKFTRWDNMAGLGVVWDLSRVVLSVGYDHENFAPVTARFKYLERASEWFVASAAGRIGENVQAGLEGQASRHDYELEATLNDNLRIRGGPFIELTTASKITLRAGGGYDAARYDASAVGNDDFDDYYAYARLQQETRLFTHAITASREHELGDNANNLTLNQVRYSISSPVLWHVELGANVSANFAEEFGGTYKEDFTYYRAGLGLKYHFHKYWSAGVDYEYLLKDSDVPLRDFYRNRISLELAYSF